MRAKLIITLDLEDISPRVINWIEDPEALCNTVREGLEEDNGVTVHDITITKENERE